MKAERIDGQAVNGSRTVLSNVLPLDTPYSVTYFPIYACNFKCNYCLHSLNYESRGHISNIASMDFQLFKKSIDDMAAFPKKIKAIHFAGLGEPLLHKDIDSMVGYIVQKGVADTVDIVTNGALLTPELSKKLIKAGLTKIRISVQGLSGLKYKEVTGKDIEFDNFLNNIRYFYENKGDSKIYIKIIDSALEEGEEDKFLNMFGEICDSIAIEHLCPFVGDIDYENTFGDKEFIVTMNGINIVNAEICPQPFYSMQIYPDGKCIPCCTVEKPIVVGDCNHMSLVDIWRSRDFNSFRKMHISRLKNKNSVCARCQQYKYSMFPEEVLDNDAERLERLY